MEEYNRMEISSPKRKLGHSCLGSIGRKQPEFLSWSHGVGDGEDGGLEIKE